MNTVNIETENCQRSETYTLHTHIITDTVRWSLGACAHQSMRTVHHQFVSSQIKLEKMNTYF